jgi:hypothetical protein
MGGEGPKPVAEERRRLVLVEPDGVDPLVGGAIARLTDARRRTLRDLEGLDPAHVDRPGPDGTNSVGAILYHVAAIEMAWLAEEILGLDAWPPGVEHLLPYDVRDEAGLLWAVRGQSLDDHLERLRITREVLVRELAALDTAEFRRVRVLADYDVTPEWVAFHLTQHEAEHRSELGRLRAAASTG